MVQAGRLRHVVTIEKNSGSTRDSVGGSSPSWVPLEPDVRAEVKFHPGRTYQSAGQDRSSSIYKVTLHESPVTVLIAPHEYRLIWNGKTLLVDSVGDPEGQDRDIVLMCRLRT